MIISARAQLAAKIESVEGTAESLAAANAVLVANPKFTTDHEVTERGAVSASLSQFSRVVGKRYATFEFDVELKGSGAAGTPPALGKLLEACGFAETVVESTSATYLPASSGIESLTMALYQDGLIKKGWGCRGDVSVKFESGKPAFLHFVFKAAGFSVSDGALLSGVTYESTMPQPFLGASFTIDSYAAVLSMLELKANNNVVLRGDVNQASGYLSAVITGKRKWTLSMDPEQVLVATYDFYDKLHDGNEGALTTTLGATAGNIVTVTGPKLQYINVSEEDRDGIASLGIECAMNRNAGDDEVSFAFT
jgi:hypothetical protein